MTTQAQHRAAAATRHDVQRAVTNIIRRGGDAEVQAVEIHAAYTGRYDLREKPTAVKCPDHPYVTPITGTACPMPHEGDS